MTGAAELGKAGGMIEASHLSKHYGAVRAVDDVSFRIPAGKVVGFLGPNGAGKSTAMRCLTGLTLPTSGAVSVCGRPFAQLPNPGRHVGVLLDASAQHGGRTGLEVLTLGAMTMGISRGRVREIAAMVGLSDKEIKRRIKNYSLGMRQRLGIAHALLGDPKILILDEPANGLDPSGIRWMRDLLRGFADQGGAVLLSSHLLNEVETIADELIVIGRGRIVAQGTKEMLLGGTGTVVNCADGQDKTSLTEGLAQAGFSVRQDEHHALIVDADAATIGIIARDRQVALTALHPAHSAGLEELFFQVTSQTSREGAAA
ncbi:Vitamin B12 import ATP-binding protein BtuD [Austwickia sp. TVS 96-490-7B]|uniref:ABC transporter ATP-binding protein n=1 Tax=Austwickia sp. TVS 96-490-7B TaxID=2830843 RepID=UPI001D49435D|nr:ATP-binding cassette domain-containing protein [Austwickia sp. TVS 96-490-7B]MBW3086012.1 Vitamin B12 import ATP-binding protein BtuD [Austwickia sp. TVS 96-490-7B]